MANSDNNQPAGREEKKLKGRPLSHLDRLIQAAVAEDQILGHPEDPAREAYPLLWAWLSSVDAGRTHVKTPAKIMLQLGPAGVVASLRDNDLTSSVDVGCSYLGDVLKAFEDILGRPDCPIRNWGKKQPTLRKRRSNS